MSNNIQYEQFRISSGLKNLIGKELITDEFVAIFELVKNAFDAHATSVKIYFINTHDKDNAKIIIGDNGKGMDNIDLKEKWLFVAYSAKKDGTEDYRDKIKTKRAVAGAKGVGRFSCDRLGSKLTLITIKDSEHAKVENLSVNWDNFEQDPKEEFININVEHTILEKNPYPEIVHGTILEITGLRDEWNRVRLLKLKTALQRLINPNKKNSESEFTIEIICEDEAFKDEKAKMYKDRVNGAVKNFVFETLDVKTTQIISKISADGERLTTTLIDRGEYIYEIVEKNKHQKLNDIEVHLFQLNRMAKQNFTLIMGLEPVKYGSVFMYRNGFRIYPFGEPDEDVLGINKRKAQGYNRFLGTRDLIGRIEISNHPDLTETTSRDGGLIKNDTYFELENFFTEKILKRLEKYVVEVIRWGNETIDEKGKSMAALNPENVKKEILNIISNLVSGSAEDIIEVNYNKDFLEVLEKSQEKSVNKVIKNLEKIADKTNDIDFIKGVEIVKKEVKALKEDNTKLEQENINLKEETLVKEEKIKEKEDKIEAIKEDVKRKEYQVLFGESLSKQEVKQIVALHHQIGIYSNTIDLKLRAISKKIAKKEKISLEDLMAFVQEIAFENSRIQSVSKIAGKANFDLNSSKIEADIISYIKKYIDHVSRFFVSSDMKISFEDKTNQSFIYKFIPVDLTIVIDNLMSNSRKANAKNFTVTTDIQNNELILSCIDDGNGLDKSIQNPNDIFGLGFKTGFMGSGIGLYHVSQIISELGGTINIINNKSSKGVEFIIKIKNNETQL